MEDADLPYRMLFNRHPYPMWVYERETGRFLAVNDAAIRHYGYTRDEFLALNVRDIRPPSELPRLEAALRRPVANLEPSGTWRHRKKDGSIIVVESASHDLTFFGRPARLGIITDVTALGATQADLESERRLLRTLVDLIPDGIYVKDRGSRFILANDALARLMGVPTSSALVGKADTDFYPPELAAQFRADEEQVLFGEPLLHKEELIPNTPQGDRILLTSKLPLPNADGEITAVLGIGRDITERKRAERRLGLQHEVTLTLSQAGSSGEVQRKVLQTVCRGLNWDLGELWLRDRAHDRLRLKEVWHRPSDSLQSFVAASREISCPLGVGLVGGVWNSAEPAWIADASVDERSYRRELARPAGLHGQLAVPIVVQDTTYGVACFFSRQIQSPDPEMLGILGAIGVQIGQSIERHQLSEQFRQTQKMEAIGTLAGGIAHDFNNILGAIIGYTQLIEMEIAPSSATREYIRDVLAAANRATELVRQILTFSRQQPQERRPIDLAPIVGEAMKLLRATTPSSIRFAVDVAPELPAVLADSTQVHQVIMNLGTNAAQAMGEGPGRLSLTLEPFEISEDVAEAHQDLRAGHFVRLTVTDTGKGMDAETQARIFEPFFTTKAPGEGTGLGLSVVHGIMSSHDGHITVYSEPGEGTTFRLYFPALRTEADISALQKRRVPYGSGQRILYVDDEPALAVMGKKILEKVGYIVEAHSDSAAALEAFRKAPSAYAAAITDQAMPKLTGADLARHLLALRPDLPILLLTGYTASLTPDKVRSMGLHKLLFKPLTVESLATALHEALTAPR